MKMPLRAPLAARYARLSPEDKDQNPENQPLKASHARAWSSDEFMVAPPTDIYYTPLNNEYTPMNIEYLSMDFTGRMAICAVTEALNGREMVCGSMMVFMDTTTAFVSFITVAHTKMTACTANSIMTPCGTRRVCYFVMMAKGASSNSGMAKCKISLIPQWAWLNSLEEC